MNQIIQRQLNIPPTIKVEGFKKGIEVLVTLRENMSFADGPKRVR